MPCQSDEEDQIAPSPPGFSTLASNDGAGHADPDAAGSKAYSDPDVEKQFNKLKGKKLEYHPYLQYTEVIQWKTCPDSVLEPAQINHEIHDFMKS